MPWYTISNMDQLDTPALVVYPDRVKYNIELLKYGIDQADRIRVHVKSHKSAAVTQLQMEAGIRKFKCATIAEAEMLGICKAPDALLAYQPNGPKLQRFIAVIRQYPNTNYSCLVDNMPSAINISKEALQADIVIKVYLDLNVGMNRTGITPGEDALQIYQACIRLPGLQVLGLHAYDGHIHDVAYAIRQRRADEAYEGVQWMQQAIINSGLPVPAVITGGSPTFPVHAQRAGIEVSAGTFIYWDEGYLQHYQEQAFQPAALVVSRVVSLPEPGIVCLDVGHKSVASESSLDKRIYFLNAPQLKVMGHSEEHLITQTEVPHSLQVGDVLYGMPYHVCPTVALYERAFIIEQGRMTGEWITTARDRKINI